MGVPQPLFGDVENGAAACVCDRPIHNEASVHGKSRTIDKDITCSNTVSKNNCASFIGSSIVENDSVAAVEFCQCSGISSSLNLCLSALKEAQRVNDIVSKPGLFNARYGKMGASIGHSSQALKDSLNGSHPASIIVGFDTQKSTFSESVRDQNSTLLDSTIKGQSPSHPSVLDDTDHQPSGSLRKKAFSPLSNLLTSSNVECVLECSEGDRKHSKEERDEIQSVNNVDGSNSKFMLEDASTGFCVYQTAKCRYCNKSSPLPIPLTERGSQAHRVIKLHCLCLQTDGPLLTHNEVLRPGDTELHKHAQGLFPPKAQEERIGGLIHGVSYHYPSQQSISSGLSLSPLGPKCVSRVQGSFSTKVDYGNSVVPSASSPLFMTPFKHIVKGQSRSETDVEKARERSLFVDEECEDLPHKREVQCQRWSYEAVPSVQMGCKPVGGSHAATARRSLVGSFEESLLSGRFLAGKPCQKLEGFLALLSVTGGCWSPPLQKLPFSVTCVDGDSSLLYFASIELIDNNTSSNYKGNKSKKNGTLDESRGNKNRLRIPVSGRVQLLQVEYDFPADPKYFHCN